jgi:hypothetical protein
VQAFRIGAGVVLMLVALLFAAQNPAEAAYRQSYGDWTYYKNKGYHYRYYNYAPSYHHEVHYYANYPRKYYYYNPYSKKYWGYMDLDHTDKYYKLKTPTEDVESAAKGEVEDSKELPVMKDDKGKETDEKLMPPPKDKNLLPPK